MGCIHSLRREPKDNQKYIETLTLKRRVTKKVDGKNVKISISVVADQTVEDDDHLLCCDDSHFHLHHSHSLKSRDSSSKRNRNVRTLSFVEGRKFTKFPNMQGYKMCLDCNEHKKDVLKTTQAGDEEKELCRKCLVKTRHKKTSPEKKSEPALEVPDGPESAMAKMNMTAFASLLALTALDLTAPASEALLKNRKNTWIQLAGHPGAFAPAGPNTIWKKRHTKDNSETLAYQQLMEDSAHSIVPMFYREVEYNSEYFIEIEDLLQHFSDPNIMDIKMGTRTFLESEVQNGTQRKDLYEKMIALDPSAPTTEEQRVQSVTKLRYMQFREQESSTADYGFRIEALRTSGELPNTNLKKVKCKEQIREVFAKFIENNRAVQNSLVKELNTMRKAVEGSKFFMSHEVKCKEQIREVFAKFIENNRAVQNSLVKELNTMRKAVEGSKFFMSHEVKCKEQIREVFAKFIENNRAVQNSLVKELNTMRKAVEGSKFFMSHEIIGSSILIIYDRTEKCGTWLIDFSKTSPMEEGCSVNHRSPWQNGNREDGFLFGLDNLIQFLAELEVKEEAIDFSDSRPPCQDNHLT